jgi:hypothetical protein
MAVIDSNDVLVNFAVSVFESFTLTDSFRARGWFQINNNQDPGWTDIDDNQ